MDHGSFSSFPGFSSFPAGPSPTAEQPKPSEKPHKDRKKKKKHRDRNETNSPVEQRVEDDEHRKVQEDCARLEAEKARQKRIYYSDRKGDQLNVKYGGLDSRDVPKYTLVARECTDQLIRTD